MRGQIWNQPTLHNEMGNTNAERQARWRQRQKARIDEKLAQARDRIAELETALKQAQVAPPSPPSSSHRPDTAAAAEDS